MKEYYNAMKPVAKSLDILQSEKNTAMGWLLPTLYQLMTKLENIKISAKLSLPLVTSLLSAIRDRFVDMLENAELIAAAILSPKFKNSWTDQSSIIRQGKFFRLIITSRNTLFGRLGFPCGALCLQPRFLGLWPSFTYTSQ